MKRILNTLFFLATISNFAQEETVNEVRGNVKNTISTATEVISFTKIITIVIVIVLTWGLMKLLDWFFKNLVKNFNRHRLKILRLQPIIKILVWTLAVYTLIITQAFIVSLFTI